MIPNKVSSNFDASKLVTPILIGVLGYLIKFNFEVINEKLDTVILKQHLIEVHQENIRSRIQILEKSDDNQNRIIEEYQKSYFVKPDEIKFKNK